MTEMFQIGPARCGDGDRFGLSYYPTASQLFVWNLTCEELRALHDVIDEYVVFQLPFEPTR